MPKPRHSSGKSARGSRARPSKALLPGLEQYADSDGDSDGRERIEIDGGILEGGGQILRSSLAYAAILGSPVRIRDIRKNREKPGLRPQHMTGVNLVAEVSHATTFGSRVDSCELLYTPPMISGEVNDLPLNSPAVMATRPPFLGNSTSAYTTQHFLSDDSPTRSYVADTGTAGSVSLLIQGSLPVLLFTPGETRLVLRGGTDVDHSPPIDYITKVFQEVVHGKLGLKPESGSAGFEIGVVRRGLHPRGGGEVIVDVRGLESGQQLHGFSIVDRGRVESLTGYAWSSPRVPANVLEEMEHTARRVFRKAHLPIYSGNPQGENGRAGHDGNNDEVPQ
ncbi:hypothetical protein HDU93_004239, partial [Gonapodya sp. JEL0774]